MLSCCCVSPDWPTLTDRPADGETTIDLCLLRTVEDIQVWLQISRIKETKSYQTNNIIQIWPTTVQSSHHIHATWVQQTFLSEENYFEFFCRQNKTWIATFSLWCTLSLVFLFHIYGSGWLSILSFQKLRPRIFQVLRCFWKKLFSGKLRVSNLVNKE